MSTKAVAPSHGTKSVNSNSKAAAMATKAASTAAAPVVAKVRKDEAGEAGQQPPPPPLSRFEQEMLDAHNVYRQHHSAGALAPSAALARRAQAWADRLAASNSMWHEGQRGDGENLAMKYHSARQNFSGTEFVNMWYYEGLHYRFPGTQLEKQNGGGKNFVTGHFTQVVWKNSKHVGFGRAVSKTGRVYVVARYSPPGNYIGRYNANVMPPVDGKLRCRYQPAA